MTGRSDAALAYRKWYALKAWRDRRRDQLSRVPLCEYCEIIGRTSEATVADHIIAHRGDEDLFWHGGLRSLCKPCHDSVKAAEEARGYHSLFDADGYPLDVSHPTNRPRPK